MGTTCAPRPLIVVPPTPTCVHHTVHMALMGYFIVFSFVTKPGQTFEFLLWGTIVPLNFLAGYYCSIVANTPTTYGVRVHPVPHLFTFVIDVIQLPSHVGVLSDIGRVIPVVISQYIMEKDLKDRSIVTGNHQHWSLQICSIRSLLPTSSVPARLVSYLHPIKDNNSMLLAYHSRDTLCWRSDVTLRGSWC